MSHADNKRERLEQAEHMLLTTIDGMTASELARYLRCDRTTVHRYMQLLDKRYGLVEVEHGRYRLNPDSYLSEVSLSIPEALSIYLALRRFARQTTHAPVFAISALQKIAPALRHPTLTEQLQQASLELQSDRMASEVHTQVWEILLRGWRENIVVRIEHVKARASDVSRHEIEPYLFEPAILSHGDYVIAWSRTRDELRTFKIARIQRASLTTAKFEKPADFNFDDLLRTAWGIWYGKKTVKVELLFLPGVVSRVKETLWHPSQQMMEQEDGSLYWTVEVAATMELRSWVRGWGHEVKVLGPPEFREQILEDLRDALALYEGE